MKSIKAVERVWTRNESYVNNKIVKRLKYGLNVSFLSEEELLQEARLQFFSLFYDFYEDDNQYLKFIFIVVKNRMRNLKRNNFKRESVFVTDPVTIASRAGLIIDDEREMKNNPIEFFKGKEDLVKECLSNELFNIIKEKIEKLFDSDTVAVLQGLVSGKTQVNIADEMLLPVHVVNGKVRNIRKVTKQILEEE